MTAIGDFLLVASDVRDVRKVPAFRLSTLRRVEGR